MAKLEFFYDVGSAYSYLAATQVEAIARDCGADLVWRPFLLGAVFKMTGNTMPAAVAPRARYMFADLKRWAAYYGVPFHFSPHFPPNTLTAMRMLAAAPSDRVAPLTHELFKAMWVDGADLSSPAVLTEIDPELFARASEPDVKEALKATTAEAVERGAFGAPAMFVGDELFFGNDRLPFVEQRLRG